MEGSMERIPERRDTRVKKVKKRTQSRAEERKAVKIGRILQSYGTRRDETKERRDGWNCT